MSHRLSSLLTLLCLLAALVLVQRPLPPTGTLAAEPVPALGDHTLYLPLIIRAASAADTPAPTTAPPGAPTPTATATASGTPVETVTLTATLPPATATPTATDMATLVPTTTLTGTPPPMGTPTATPTVSPTASLTASPTPSATSTATVTALLSPTLTGSPTPTGTVPPTSTATAGASGPTPSPTATVTAAPTQPVGHVAFVPLLGASSSVTQTATSLIAAQNVGRHDTKLAVLYFDAPAAECPSAPPPFKLECSGLLKPGSNWVFTSPASAGSAVVFSFDPVATANPDYYQCEQLQTLLGRPWPNEWPGVSAAVGEFPFTWNPFHGEPVAVAVRRSLTSPPPDNRPLESVYPGVGTETLGGYNALFGGYSYYVPTVYSAASGLSTWLTVQNSGTECTSIELWFRSQDNCFSASVCEVLQIAPGHAARVNAAACLAQGVVGTVWARSAQPLAIGVDHVGRTVLMSGSAEAEDPSLNSGLFNGGSTDRIILESPVLHQTAPSAVRVTVQNPSPVVSASVKVLFLDEHGSIITTFDRFVCPRGSETFAVQMPSGSVGAVRVESLAWSAPGDPFVNQVPVMAEVETVRYTSDFAVPLEAASYRLLPSQGYTWQEGGRQVQGRPVLAFPLVANNWPLAGETVDLAIQNTVNQPGVTGVAVLVYDQNGLAGHSCLSLSENQVAYLDLNALSILDPGSKGALVISATYWQHPAPPDVQTPWVVGLIGVVGGRLLTPSSTSGDRMTAMTGIPVPPSPGLLPPTLPALCPPPAPVPTVTPTRTP